MAKDQAKKFVHVLDVIIFFVVKDALPVSSQIELEVTPFHTAQLRLKTIWFQGIN